MNSRSFSLLSCTVAILLCAGVAKGSVSYWDPEGATFSYATYTGGISLSGSWEGSLWSRNSGGAPGPNADLGTATQAFTEGDAAVFCVGAGSSNNTAGGTTTFVVTMNAIHTNAGIFDGSLSPKSCKVTISGTGTLWLTNGFDAFNLKTNATDNSQAVVTLNVLVDGPGVLTAENSGGQIFLNASNTWTGGTQLGFPGQPAFTGTINFSNNNSLGTGPIVISGGNSTTFGTLQCTNSGVLITNAIDFTHGQGTPAYLNLASSNGGSITFGGPVTCGGTNGNIGVTTGSSITATGAISGTAGFGKFGAGTLVLGGNNTYSGGTTISGGTLNVGGGTTSGNLGTGSIVNSGTLIFNRSGNLSENDTITGAGTLTQAGPGTLTLGSGANSYTGVTTISGGTLQLGNQNAIPSGSPVKIGSGAVLDLNGSAPTLTSVSGAGNVINSSGTFIVNGNLTTGGANTTYSCLSGAINGSGILDKQGTHAMALRGASTFSGGFVEMEGGILSVGAAPNRLPTGADLFMLGGTFQLDANNQTFSALTGGGNINLGGGTLTINQTSSFGDSEYDGVIRNTDIGTASTASGNGLRGYYYDNIDLTNLKAVRDDATVNFSTFTVTNAVTGLPNAGIATNTFSVRWLGQVLTTGSAGTYTFTTTCDDGSRLWVNGALVVDNWVDQGAIAKSGTISLAANTKYDLVMEYYQNGVGCSAVLSWTPPGGSAAVIPTGNLFLPGAGAFVKLGNATLSLGAVNTYNGNTYVSGGTLEILVANGLASTNIFVTNSGSTLKLDSATALKTAASLILNTNGGATPTVNLNFAGSMQLGQLSLDGGSTFVNGSWGSGTSGAQHTSSRFTGNGQFSLGSCSSTNRILTITNSGFRTVKLVMQGTPNSQYYVLTHTNVLQPLSLWTPVTGSTNTPTGNGIWTLSISNPAPTAAYRVKATSPCP